MNWNAFLTRHDFHWDSLPESWNDGAFLGNGMLGVMVWFERKTGTLRLEIGRCDICDRRPSEKSVNNVLYDQPRLMIGAFHWCPNSPELFGEMQLSLWNAELSGRIGKEEFRIFIPHGLDAIIFESEAGKLSFDAAEAISPRILYWNETPDAYIPNQPPQYSKECCTQELYSGDSFSTQWERRAGHWLISCGWSAGAEQELTRAATRSINEWRSRHRRSWHNWYRRSFLSVPDVELECFYWRQIYKLFAATHSSGVVLDLLGPWPKVTPWPAIWWNLNLQLTYSPLFAANRMELCRPLLRCLSDRFEVFRDNAPAAFRNDSAAVGRASSYDCVSPSSSEFGNLTWICHSYYLYYRYSMNRTVLKPLFRLLKGCVNFYRHIMYRGDDGKWHLPPTHSPEFGDTADCCYDLALLRWGCQTLLELSDIHQLRNKLVDVWHDILENLTEYPEDERGFRVGADLSFDRSHRHYSHLFMVYPLDLRCDEKTTEKSIDNYLNMPEEAAGYTFTGGAAMKARQGNGEAAARLLHTLLHWMNEREQKNTMYEEAGPVIETPLAFAASLQEMLLQSHGGIIRIFPAIPTDWNDVSFNNLRAEGAFLVSAKRENGILSEFTIKSLAGQQVKLQTAPDQPPFMLALRKGETYTFPH